MLKYISMNYLAHLYLSGNNEQIMTGNFIGDFVKGNRWQKYPAKIAEGILLHRKIDAYTDAHHKFREARSLFTPDFRLYSGIIIDFLYDHFLAKNWEQYSEISLNQFSFQAYTTLLRNYFKLPAQVQQFLPFMIKNRRLESYATVDGILEAMRIMSKYSSLPNKPDRLNEILLENYPFLQENFSVFMADIMIIIETWKEPVTKQ